MKKNSIFKIIFFLLIIIFSQPSFCQKNYVDKVNLLNDKGKKDGYWVEDRGNYGKVELYYKEGLKSGIFKRYSKQGKLLSFGEYKNDIMSGIWYYFGDKGHLMSINKLFSINIDSVLIDTGKKYKPRYKCYSISFYPNGNIKEEGFWLWDDDPLLDTSFEFGEWKYYNEYGKLMEIKNFK